MADVHVKPEHSVRFGFVGIYPGRQPQRQRNTEDRPATRDQTQTLSFHHQGLRKVDRADPFAQQAF